MKKIKAITDKDNKLLLVMEGKESKVKTIYKPWLAAKLRDMGHKIIKQRADERNPMYDCWDFEVDDTFEEDLRQIMEDRK